MGKRSFPLLYIHQNKEIEAEAHNQEVFYRNKLVVTNKSKTNVKVDQLEIEKEIRRELERGENTDQNISEKLDMLNAIPDGVKPIIEVNMKDESYVGVLHEMEEGTIVLKTQKIPYEVTCQLSDVSSIKIISF